MKTTIAISVEIKEKLNSLGKKGETYDEILERLIKCCEEVKKK